jgi:heme oxygenase
VTTPSKILHRLAAETRPHHASADADRISLMDAASEADYARHLARIYGFESGVEHALDGVRGLEPRITGPRKKAERLTHDLAALGMSARQVTELPRYLVTICSPTQALGWMFVVERLTLLSGLIRRHLEARLPDVMPQASAYLSAYGPDTGAKLRALGEECERHGRRCVTEPIAMVAAANAAFRQQRLWFSKLRSRPITAPGYELSRALAEPLADACPAPARWPDRATEAAPAAPA